VKKERYVLDAWAILALLQKEEPAASRVRQLLEEAEGGSHKLFISIINLGEIIYRIGKAKGEREAQKNWLRFANWL
jgi:predicted nucleic acid-binding protein